MPMMFLSVLYQRTPFAKNVIIVANMGHSCDFFSTAVAGIATYTCSIQVSSGFISPLFMVKYMMSSSTWFYYQVREGKQEQQQ